MTKLINKTIKARREELGLSDVFVAATCGLTIDEYVDVEMHADEFETLVRLDDAKLYL